MGPPIRKWEIWLPGIWRKLSYLRTFFASVFTGKSSSHTTQGAEGKDRGWENGEPPTVEDQVWDRLRNLKLHKSWNTRRRIYVCPEVDGIVKPLSIMFEESWQSNEDPTGCKGETEPPFLKRGKKEGARLCPARWWRRLSWKLCSGMCKIRRWFVTATMDSLQTKSVWCDRVRVLWIRKEQLTSSTWTCAKDLTLSWRTALSLNWRDLKDYAFNKSPMPAAHFLGS